MSYRKHNALLELANDTVQACNVLPTHSDVIWNDEMGCYHHLVLGKVRQASFLYSQPGRNFILDDAILSIFSNVCPHRFKSPSAFFFAFFLALHVGSI